MHALEPAFESLKREFEAACSQAVRAARSQTVYELNQLFRRLRQYGSEADWFAAVLDGSCRFARQVALLERQGDTLKIRAERNLQLSIEVVFPVSSAKAFEAAIESKDPIVALRTGSEVGEALSTHDASDRAHIFPIANGSRVVAVLFVADQELLDVNGLELIAGMAAAVLERQANTALHAQIAAQPAPTAPPANFEPPAPVNGKPEESSSRPVLPPWADLTPIQRELHIRAQRFSRVAVAEMQLSRPEICRAGMEQENLYVYLKKEIDKARETYRTQFMTIPSMVDYLHLELVRTAADGNELKLGAEYPGQLV